MGPLCSALRCSALRINHSSAVRLCPSRSLSVCLQLAYCVTQFVEKDSRLAEEVIGGLLKYWPVTNCQKIVLFLGELEELLELTQQPEFANLIPSLFYRISQCLMSQHFQVAERALFLWNNETVVARITENRCVWRRTWLGCPDLPCPAAAAISRGCCVFVAAHSGSPARAPIGPPCNSAS